MLYLLGVLYTHAVNGIPAELIVRRRDPGAVRPPNFLVTSIASMRAGVTELAFHGGEFVSRTTQEGFYPDEVRETTIADITLMLQNCPKSMKGSIYAWHHRVHCCDLLLPQQKLQIARAVENLP